MTDVIMKRVLPPVPSIASRWSAWRWSLTFALRTTPAGWWTPLFTAAGLFAGWATLPHGIGYWPRFVMAADASTALAGPLVVACGALVGRRDARGTLAVWRALSMRPGGMTAVAQVLAVTLWAVVSHLLVVAVLAVHTATMTPWGEVDALGLISPTVGLVIYAGLGYVTGRLIPRLLTAPVVALVAFQVPVVAFSRRDALRLLMPYHNELVDPWGIWRSSLYTEHLAYVIGLGLLLLTAAALVNQRTAGVVVATVLAVAAALGGGALAGQHGATFYASGIPPFAYSCATAEVKGSSASMVLCLHPVFDPGRARIAAELTPIASRLVGTPGALTRVEQRPRGLGGAPSAGATAFSLDGLSARQLAELPGEFVSNELDVEACSVATPAQTMLTDAVASWIQTGRPPAPPTSAPGTPAPDAASSAAITTWSLLSDDHKRTWLAQHWEGYTHCALTPTDLTS